VENREKGKSTFIQTDSDPIALNDFQGLANVINHAVDNTNAISPEECKSIMDMMHEGDRPNSDDMDMIINVFMNSISLTSEDAEAFTDLLNQNRQSLLSYLDIPGILYQVLESEFSKIINHAQSDLVLADSTIADIHEARFTRKSLNKWKTVSTLTNLGLMDSSKAAQQRKIRAEAAENELRVIGMLIDLLCHTAPNVYTKQSGNSVNFYAIANAMEETVDTRFDHPKIGTTQKLLKSGHKMLHSQ